MRKAITLLLALTLVLGMSIASADAAAKPGKVKGLKASAKKMSVTLKWNKAKHAKKYQVLQYKNKLKKFKKVKTTSKRKVVIKNLMPGTQYKFRIRGVKGSKKGALSKIITVKTKVAKTHSGAANPKTARFEKGDTYNIKKLNSNETVKVTITRFEKFKDGETNIFGKTENGGTYVASFGDNADLCEIKEPGYTNHFTEETGSAIFDGMTSVLTVKDNDTKAYWTLDGSEPKIGQQDLTGYSKYCMEVFPNGYKENTSNRYKKFFEEEYGLKLINDYKGYIKTQLRGTAVKGKTEIHNEPHNTLYEFKRIKTYYKDKQIYEYYFLNKYHKF